jgi:hypothetical protein
MRGVVEGRKVIGSRNVTIVVWSRQVAAVAVSMSDDDPTGPCSWKLTSATAIPKMV